MLTLMLYDSIIAHVSFVVGVQTRPDCMCVSAISRRQFMKIKSLKHICKTN